MACCPAHDDSNPSLSISRGDDGRILLHCHAGCDFASICNAAGLEPAELCGSAVPATSRSSRPRGDSRGFTDPDVATQWMAEKLGGAKIAQTYVYARPDGTGGEHFRVIRFEKPDGDKTFRVMHRQSNGRWRFQDPPGQLPPYHADVLAGRPGDPVLVVEGEKCVEVAEDMGSLATTSAHGSKSPHKTDWSLLAGRDVVIWPDADEPGERYASHVATAITQLNPPARVKIIAAMNTLGNGADIADWAATGSDAAMLGTLIGNAKPWTPTRAIVNVSGPLDEVSATTLDAIETANHPPIVYVRNGRVVRTRRDENDCPIIGEVGIDELRHRAARAASFIKVRADGSICDVPPPDVVIKDLLAAEQCWPFPPLVGVTEVPSLRPDGSIVDQPGYDAATRLVYVPDPSLTIPPIPATPTPADAENAARFILDDVLGDFPFILDGPGGISASRANAVGLLLTPIMRPLIEGAVPLALIDAPVAGTGKGLLGSAVTTIATGREAPMFIAPGREEEWSKQLTSSLIKGNAVVIIDNLTRTLGSPSLSAAVTAPVWDARVLGVSRNAGVAVRVTWIGTGNNIRLGGDMPRRAYWIRLDPLMAQPWERDGFRHPELLKWVREHRGEIVAALLTMARSWYVADAPPGDLRLGSFECWSQTIGGVLDVAGVAGFLDNRADMLTQADDDGPAWAGFLAECAQVFGDKPFTVADVTAKIGDGLYGDKLRSALPDHLADAHADQHKSFARRLGKAFASIDRRRFDDRGLRVERDRKDTHTGVQRWRIAGSDITDKEL